MMKPRWRKVLYDLFGNKARTLLVVLSIAIGVFSIGVIVGAREIISTDLPVSYASSVPANVTFRMSDFDEDLLTYISSQDGVAEVEGRRVANMRVRVPGTEKWTTMDVTALEDYAENSINLLSPISGNSIPGEGEVLLELKALDELGVEIGDMIEFQLPDGSEKQLPVTGIVQDISTGAGDMLISPSIYISFETMPDLKQSELYNQAYITVTGDQDDLDHIRQVGTALRDKLEKMDYVVFRMLFSTLHAHPLSAEVNAISGVLIALGILVVFLSSSLIANTLSSLLVQHLRHIGIIKLVGGQRRQVIFMYLALILSFAVMALALAIPLGSQGAYQLALFIADSLNFSILEYRIVPLALYVQIGVGLLVPLVAGLFPVLKGSRITVVQALSGESDGSAEVEDPQEGTPGAEPKLSLADRTMNSGSTWLSARGVSVPRPLVLSLRNTFRKRSRLVLTLFTLTMGGAILIAVFNVQVSLNQFIDEIGSYFAADVSLDFDEPYRLREIEQIAMQVEGVEHVEGWQSLGAELLDSDGEVLDNISMFGPPAASTLVEPDLIAGRWLQEDDVRKLAISDRILDYFPDLQPGDMLAINVQGRQESWEVIGIFKFVDRQGVIAYAPYEYLYQINNMANQADSFRLVTSQHDEATQVAVAEELDLNFRDLGYEVRKAEPGSATLSTVVENLNTVVVFLLIMAVLTAIVGSIGLAGTMSMNVMERIREIGVMRAIGADNRAVMRTVIAEGLVIGVISFILSIIFSFPITYLLSGIVSVAIFNSPIQVVFTWQGFAIWLGLILVLSTLASLLPAQNAAKLTIREVLAYE